MTDRRRSREGLRPSFTKSEYVQLDRPETRGSHSACSRRESLLRHTLPVASMTGVPTADLARSLNRSGRKIDLVLREAVAACEFCRPAALPARRGVVESSSKPWGDRRQVPPTSTR
jgi:hypothetical protein